MKLKQILLVALVLASTSSVFAVESSEPSAAAPEAPMAAPKRKPIVPDEGLTQKKYDELGTFKTVRLNIAWEVVYTNGSKCSVLVEGPYNFIPEISVVKDGDEVVISSNETFKTDKKHPLKITVTAPDLDSIVVQGASRFLINDFFTKGDIALRVCDNGKATIKNLRCENLNVEQDGMGKADLDKCKCEQNATCAILGEGEVSISSLKVTGNLNCNVKGKGKASMSKVEVKEVHGMVEGPGTFKVSGDAIVGFFETSGSGKLDWSGLDLKSIKLYELSGPGKIVH